VAGGTLSSRARCRAAVPARADSRTKRPAAAVPPGPGVATVARWPGTASGSASAPAWPD